MSGAREPIYLMGYSGHAYVVAEAALAMGLRFSGYVTENRAVTNPFEIAYAGSERNPDFKAWHEDALFVLGIGDNDIRKKVADQIAKKQKRCLTIIHPEASVSDHLSIGAGTFIARGALVNPLCHIAEAVILNTGCIIEHECRIGQAAHIAPGATLAGKVQIGAGAFVGARAVVKQGVRIGPGAVIGAGAVVLRDVAARETWVGNPAKPLER